MTDVVRGSATYIDVIFKDENGTPVNPTSATVRLKYFQRKVIKRETYSLVNISGTTWRYIWDSTVADAGTVEWFAASADSPKCTAEGSFIIEANGANPVPPAP